MSIPSKSSLRQNEVQILYAKPHKQLIGPGGDNVLRPDIADPSDHCPVISRQTLEVRLCQWPSLAGMEHCAPHTRAAHTRAASLWANSADDNYIEKGPDKRVLIAESTPFTIIADDFYTVFFSFRKCKV